MADHGVAKGMAFARAVAATNSGQQISFGTDSAHHGVDPDTDQPVWELNAGESISLYVDEINANGSRPDNVELRIYYETGTGTLVKTVHNGAPGSWTASPLIDTFWATDDGTETGIPRAGTLRLYVRMEKTSGLAGTQYDVNSDSGGTGGVTWNSFEWGQGVLRARAKVSAIAHDGYPAGATYAYGTAGDESAGITVTHTQAFAVRGHEDVRIDALDVTAQQIAGTAKDIGSGTTTGQSFVVNKPNFDDAAKSYGAEIVPVGVAQLVPDSDPNMLWTTFVADDASVEQNGDAVRRQSFFDVDPRWALQNVAVGETLYNRLESAVHQFEIVNARGENLTRTVSWNILDGNSDVVASTSDTGPTYSNTRQVGGTERAAPDLAGDQWSILTTQADAYNEAANIYAVTRKKQIKETALAADGTAFTGKTASPTGDDKTTFNRGQDVFFHALVYNARGELLADEAGFFAPRRTDQEAYELATQAITLTAQGELTGAGATYAVPLTSVLTPAGRTLVYSDVDVQQPRTGFGGQGNFAETDVSTPEWTITDQYPLIAHANKKLPRKVDPQTTYTSGEDSVLAWGNVVDANGDPVEGATVLLELIRPDGLLKGSGEQVTIADGWTDPANVFDTSPPIDDGWILRATVENHNGNTGTADLGLAMVSAFTGDKGIGIGFGPAFTVPNTIPGRQTAQPGDHAKPGDRIILGVGLVVDQVRTAPDADPVPQFALSQFNQADKKLYILQSDFTWAEQSETGYFEHYFDFKESLEDGLEWMASFGTAAQGVTEDNGYVTDTGLWSPGGIFMAVRLYFNTQPFDKVMPFGFAGPGSMHPMSAGDVFELILEVDQGA